MSLDFAEDACDLLDKSEHPYILILGNGKHSRIFSNIGDENKEMLRGWLENGHWDQMLRQHLERIGS